MMTRVTLLPLLVAAPMLVACAAQPDDELASVEQSASVHLKGGKNAEPAFTDLGSALSASGALAGLGNGDVLVTLDALANADVTCQNPGNGEHYPPGQDPQPIGVSGETLIPDEQLKNGSTPFSVTTAPPPPTIAGAPDCPNSMWTEHLLDLAFTSATITVEQGGVEVLTISCTFSPATSNGNVPGSTVSCQ